MTDLYSKPASEFCPADITAMVTSSLPEENGSSSSGLCPRPRENATMEDRNERGIRAKNEILEEVTAFANAYGGVLFLGVEESSTKPASAAAGIAPVPRCTEWAERFKLIFRDCVEPQLPALEVFAVPTDQDDGVVIFRVGRSLSAPHRVTKTLVCPVRRADRCENDHARDSDMTLTFRRASKGSNDVFLTDPHAFLQNSNAFAPPNDAFGCRFTAVPTK